MVRVKICAVSHIGNSQEKNEDNFFLQKEEYISHQIREHMDFTRAVHCTNLEVPMQDLLIAVSDGMGGHACGEEASFLTVKFLSEHYEEIINSIKDNENILYKNISYINNEVVTKSKKDSSCRGMGATLCGIVACKEDLIGFNIGDSRLYRFSDDQLIQISVDHTEGQRLVNMQLLSKEEAENFPRRKVLHKYIGYEGEIFPDIFKITNIKENTVFMLCTDGLSDVLTDDEIETRLKERIGLEEKAKSLLNEALARNSGYGDNITVILVEF